MIFDIAVEILAGTKYTQEIFENVYKVVMKLTIVDVDVADFGTYKCVAKNSLGETDGSIKLYRKYSIISLKCTFLPVILLIFNHHKKNQKKTSVNV